MTDPGRKADDVVQLRQLVQELDRTEAKIRFQIAVLRQQETPWSTIAACLGMTKQGAQQKYRARRVSVHDRPFEV